MPQEMQSCPENEARIWQKKKDRTGTGKADLFLGIVIIKLRGPVTVVHVKSTLRVFYT